MDEQPGSDRGTRARGQGDPVAAGFGRALRALRRDYGLSRQDVAAGSGLSESYIAKLEASSRQPSEKAISALADALGVDPEALVDFARQHAPPPAGDPDASGSDPSAAAAASAPPTDPPRPTRDPTRSGQPRRPRRRGSASALSDDGGDADLPDDLAFLLQLLESLRSRDPERSDDIQVLVTALANVRSSGQFNALIDIAHELLKYNVDVEDVEALARITKTLLDDATPATPTQVWPLLQLADVLADDIDTTDPTALAGDIHQLLELLPARLFKPGSANRLAHAPANTPFYLFATAITRDEDGHIWLSPAATVVDFGSDTDARILRLPDGGCLIDATRCPRHRSRPRDPHKHTIRPIELEQLPEASDPEELQALAAQYRWGNNSE